MNPSTLLISNFGYLLQFRKERPITQTQHIGGLEQDETRHDAMAPSNKDESFILNICSFNSMYC